MQPIRKALRRSLVVCLIITLCLPLGGVLLGVGLGMKAPAMWGIGIALLVVGFYGTPIAWSSGYAPKKSLERVVAAVMEEHLSTVREIAAQLDISEDKVRKHLTMCFRKQYLPGIKREGDILIRNDNAPIGHEEEYAECTACGARFLAGKDSKVCPYCGTPVRKK